MSRVTGAIRIATCALFALLGAHGCSCPESTGEAAASPIFPDIDFDTLDRYARLTYDLTQYREGELSKSELLAAHEDEEGAIELRVLEDQAHEFFLITYDDGNQLIVLPGTTNMSDIERDLMLVPVMDKELGVNLHEGFRSVALALRENLADDLTTTGRVRVTGYSLGGAAAVILAAYLDHDGFDISTIVTFGQPRVTDEAGVEAFSHLPLKRIVSGDDPICSYPAGYHQFGDALILLDGPAVVSLAYGSDDYTLLDELVVALSDSTFEDHVSYASRMTQKVGVDLIMVAFSGRSCYLKAPGDLASWF